MNEVRLSLQSDDGEYIDTISGIFEISDIEKLRKYIGFVDRVRESKFLLRGVPSITNMSMNSESGVTFTCAPYENNELYELLHVLRPLILSEEACSFKNISGLLGKKFHNAGFRKHLKFNNFIFESGEYNLYMQISVGEIPLLSDSTLKLWLNGVQYHTDLEKSEKWHRIERVLSVENSRALVITQIKSKIKAIFHLEYLANLVVQHHSKNT